MVITVFIALSAIVRDIQFQFPLNSIASMEVKRKITKKEMKKTRAN